LSKLPKVFLVINPFGLGHLITGDIQPAETQIFSPAVI